MRSLHSLRPGSITVRRTPAITALLLFTPVIAVITLLPWFWSATSTLGAALTTCAGLVWVGGVALLAARPRRQVIPVSDTAELVLEESTEGDDACYRVLLDDHGQLEVVLEHDDPGRALRELRRLQDGLGIAVRPGWGLTASAVEHPTDSAPARLANADVSGSRWQAQGRTALASCLGSLFILGVTAFTFSKVGSGPTMLGRVLPLLFAALLALVGAALLLLRLRVRTTDAGVRVDTVLGPLRLAHFELPAASISRADAVGARGDRPQHVVFHTSDGPRAIPLVGVPASVVARAVVPEPRRREEPRVSWARLPRDHHPVLEENPC